MYFVFRDCRLSLINRKKYGGLFVVLGPLERNNGIKALRDLRAAIKGGAVGCEGFSSGSVGAPWEYLTERTACWVV